MMTKMKMELNVRRIFSLSLRFLFLNIAEIFAEESEEEDDAVHEHMDDYGEEDEEDISEEMDESDEIDEEGNEHVEGESEISSEEEDENFLHTNGMKKLNQHLGKYLSPPNYFYD